MASSNESPAAAAAPPYIKRPLNSFMLFSQEQRPSLKEQNPDMHHSDISRLIGQQWRNLTKAEKDVYIAQARRVKEEHKRANPGYKYQPKRRGSASKLKSAGSSSRSSSSSSSSSDTSTPASPSPSSFVDLAWSCHPQPQQQQQADAFSFDYEASLGFSASAASLAGASFNSIANAHPATSPAAAAAASASGFVGARSYEHSLHGRAAMLPSGQATTATEQHRHPRHFHNLASNTIVRQQRTTEVDGRILPDWLPVDSAISDARDVTACSPTSTSSGSSSGARSPVTFGNISGDDTAGVGEEMADLLSPPALAPLDLDLSICELNIEAWAAAYDACLQ
jgi:hypothetical protein